MREYYEQLQANKFKNLDRQKFLKNANYQYGNKNEKTTYSSISAFEFVFKIFHKENCMYKQLNQ